MRYADGQYREKLYTVYMHITPNNKSYVGITCQSLECRWNDGDGYKHQRLFWRAIQKYGWENIKHIELFNGLSFEDASNIEKDLIRQFESNNPKYGYNLTDGGEGMSGYKFTAEQLAWRSKVSTGRKHTQATKDKLSKMKKGSKLNLTDEQRQACAERGRIQGIKNKGRKHTEEECNKIKEAVHKRYANGGIAPHCKPHTEETKRKISEKQKGRVISEEHREKLRQAALKQWQRQKGGIKNEIQLQ